MYTQSTLDNSRSLHSKRWSGGLNINLTNSRKVIIGLILTIALVAFEIFNFDTTRYALQSLLGDVNFIGLKWAVVLAIAFCAIDFAGLARLFTPEQGQDEPRAVWYLTGAWLLGATMNAIMTWWAVNLTLLNHDLGNEILSRQELIRYVPLFVAVLVWLTRILFIGAFSVAGEHLFDLAGNHVARPASQKQRNEVNRSNKSGKVQRQPRPKSRIRRQPQMPGGTGPVPAGMQAQGREL